MAETAPPALPTTLADQQMALILAQVTALTEVLATLADQVSRSAAETRLRLERAEHVVHGTGHQSSQARH